MKIETKNINDVTMISVQGDFTFNNLEGVRNTLKNAVTSSACSKFLVNLWDVRHIDSSGLGTIVSVYKTVVSRHGTFGVLVQEGDSKDVFYTIGLNKLFPIFNNEKQALETV